MPRGKTQAPKRIGRALQARLRRVQLLAMDVDGVLTDAGMYYSESVHREGESCTLINLASFCWAKLFDAAAAPL